jgi:hypothetical protein
VGKRFFIMKTVRPTKEAYGVLRFHLMPNIAGGLNNPAATVDKKAVTG